MSRNTYPMEADKRFTHIANDPKFRRIPKSERKVKIDERFQSMFNDKQFKVKYTVDKRGRPVNHSTTEDLKRYYDLESEEVVKDNEDSNEEVPRYSDVEPDDSSAEEEDSQKDIENVSNLMKKSTANKSINCHLTKVDSSDKKVLDPIKNKLKNLTVDYARGEGNLFSGDSSSDDDDESDDIEAVLEDDIDHKWGELDAEAECTEEVTCRLAACNMDWDRIRATDLMVLFNSFLPSGGSILSVVIYPSEFGKKRLAEEEIKGPAELIQQPSEGNDDGNEEGGKYHMEKLRQYQLNRLKYYYAVVTCDSATSASKIYAECDGMEYESSATKIDLRFIPDDMQFDDEYKELCNQLPELAKYKPRFFTTTALQQAKVDLTWDETNPDRVVIAERVASGKIDDIADSDLQAYLASSSGEEEEEEPSVLNSEDGAMESGGKKQKTIAKYKMLLQEIEEKEKSKEKEAIGMEFTWGIDLQNKTEKIVKEKKAAAESKTPFEQFLDKRKERRKEKREAKKMDQNHDDSSDIPSDVDINDTYFAEEFNTPEFKQKKQATKTREDDVDLDSELESESADKRAQLELLLHDVDDKKKHFNLKQIQDVENDTKAKKKRKNKKAMEDVDDAQDEFHVNVNDERFSALFTSHLFNIDPTDSHYKKTKNMEKLIEEKIKRRMEIAGDDATGHKKQKPNEAQEKIPKSNAELSVLVKSVKRKAEAFKNKSRNN